MLQSSLDYPTKPVRLIEPFGAGGGPDLVGRALAQKLTGQWGQPVTMENISGRGDGGSRAGRQVASRWLHLAGKHQRSDIQRRPIEEPAIRPAEGSRRTRLRRPRPLGQCRTCGLPFTCDTGVHHHGDSTTVEINCYDNKPKLFMPQTNPRVRNRGLVWFIPAILFGPQSQLLVLWRKCVPGPAASST